MDKVYRSYGILKNCKKISINEAMNHLSNVWLGIYTEITKNTIFPKINIYNIMMNIQTGNLIERFNIKEEKDIELYRAKYLNNIFN